VREIVEILGGLTNMNYKVTTTSDDAYVVRVSPQTAAQLAYPEPA